MMIFPGYGIAILLASLIKGTPMNFGYEWLFVILDVGALVCLSFIIVKALIKELRGYSLTVTLRDKE
jgi:ABC-type multidrug transport system permease subunit